MIVVVQRNSRILENTGCTAGVGNIGQNTIKECGDLAGKNCSILSGFEMNSGEGGGRGVGVEFYCLIEINIEPFPFCNGP